MLQKRDGLREVLTAENADSCDDSSSRSSVNVLI